MFFLGLLKIQEKGIFHFPYYQVDLKYGLVQLVIDWKQTPSSASILYDSKYVTLLVSMIIGKKEFVTKKFDSKKMDFIKGSIMVILIWFCRSTGSIKQIDNQIALIYSHTLAAFRLRIGSDAHRHLKFGEYTERLKQKWTKNLCWIHSQKQANIKEQQSICHYISSIDKPYISYHIYWFV